MLILFFCGVFSFCFFGVCGIKQMTFVAFLKDTTMCEPGGCVCVSVWMYVAVIPQQLRVCVQPLCRLRFLVFRCAPSNKFYNILIHIRLCRRNEFMYFMIARVCLCRTLLLLHVCGAHDNVSNGSSEVGAGIDSRRHMIGRIRV